jgi:diguanylate cyclase (GGDEF)-like protein
MPASTIETRLSWDQAGSRLSRAFLALWQRAQRTVGSCPTYADFNLNTLDPFSKSLLVLRPLADGDFFYGYFSPMLGSDARQDLTGTRHSALDFPVATELARCFRSVIDSGEPMLARHPGLRSLSVETPLGRILVTNLVPIVYRSDAIGEILQASPCPALACSRDDQIGSEGGRLTIVSVNRAAEDLFGDIARDLAGRDVFDLLSTDAGTSLKPALDDVITNRRVASLTLDLGLRSGETPQELTITAFAGGLLLTFDSVGGLQRHHADLAHRERKLATVEADLRRREAKLAALADEVDAARSSYEREVGERRRLEVELRRLAETDELTGHLNRRAFFRELQTEVARTLRYGHPPSLLYIDIDHFKQINDTRGHAAGDMILRTGIERIVAILRKQVDLVGRLGGDEFAILLPETALAGAEAVAERIRRLIAGSAFHYLDHTIPVTVSIGVAVWSPPVEPAAAPEAVDDWVARADAALYEAKKRGRNAVRSAVPLPARSGAAHD